MPTTPYDGLYKQLFSHPPMVEALLRGFVHEDWVSALDLSTLEKPNSQYISEELLQRSDDILWRVRLNLPDGRREWLYLYLLIEFQSRSDTWMALRLLTYVCLLYQDLIKSGQVKRGKLPPVFPLVLYNGEKKWQARQEVADLIAAPGGLARWVPRFRYHLLDEGRVPDEALRRLSNNLLARLIELETRADNAAAVDAATAALIEHLKGPAYASLRGAFVSFYNRVLFSKRKPGETIEGFDDLQEGRSMLAEKIEQWIRQGEHRGQEQGIAIGQEKGIVIGLDQGRQELLQERRADVLCQLQARFGELPTWARERVVGAQHEELKSWIYAVVTAETLEGVIGPEM